MRSDPLREHVVDDRLGGRPHDQRLLELLAAAVRDDRELGRKPLDVLRLLLQEALRDEQREVRVARAGLLDALVELVAQRLPNRKTVGTKHDASAHRRVVGQLGAQADVVVPRGEVLAAGRHLLVVLFCLFFCHSCCVTIAIIVNWYSLRIKSAGINLVRSAPEVKVMKLRLRAAAAGLALAVALFASAALAQSDANNFAVRTIEVDGSGETRTSPDTADLELAIETQAKTAEQAASRNAALATKVIDALKSKLGDKGKITTGGYSLNPMYSQHPSENPTIIGYTAQNTVTVHTGELDLVGALIDSAIAAGANRVNSLSFSVRDDTKARAEAIAIATRDARAQADALAAALDVKLGKVLKATTVSAERPVPIRMGRALAMSASVETPVEPGEVTVPATVSLIFEIE